RLVPVVERELAEAFRRDEYQRSAQVLHESEARYRILFENSPMALWEADYSGVKKCLDNLPLEAPADLRGYFIAHPEVVRACVGTVQILDVNQAALNLYKADIKSELMENLDKVIPLELEDAFLTDLVLIAEGQDNFEYETIHCTLDGERIDVNLNFAVVSGHEIDLSRVIISVQDISRRKEFERRLRQAESSYRSLVEQLPAIVYTKQAKKLGNIIYMSPQVKTLTGYPASSWINERNFWEKIIYTDDLGLVKAANKYAQDTGQPFRLEYRLLVTSGKLVWVREEAVLILDDNGKPLFWQGVIHDITETKQAETELWESQRRLTQLMSNLPGMVARCKLEPDWNMEFVSEGCQELLGYSAFDLISNQGKLYGSKIHPEDRSEVRRQIMDGILKGRPFQLTYRIYAANDQEKWVWEKGQGVYAAHGEPIAMEAFITDITETRLAEAAIQRHLLDMEVLYQNSVAINRLMEPEQIGSKMVKILEDELGWQHIAFRLYDPENGNVKLLIVRAPGKSVQEMEAYSKEMYKIIPDSSQGLSGWVYRTGQSVLCPRVREDERYIETHPAIRSGMYVPLRTGEKTIGSICVEGEIENAFGEQDERLLSTIANQTAISIENAQLFLRAQVELEARKKAETELLKAQERLEQRVMERTAELKDANLELEKSARLKDEFLASMSHELRTPLTGILGLSEVLQLQTYGQLSDKQMSALQHIEKSGRHLLELINDILDYSRIEARQMLLNPGVCQLEQICQGSLRAVSDLVKSKKLNTSFSIDPPGIAIQADGQRLKQMIGNLISNAIKFTPKGGNIGISVTGSQAENLVIITVWDTGIGIRSEDLPRLFQAFVQLDGSLTRQYNGTGLGLALVRRLAELHGGSVSVASTPGSGSQFSIKLPWKST
ncbi:MAG: PAS domain-containing protein, partial [Chloroflexota bacterium]